MSGPYQVHVFVCLGGKTCPTQGAEEVWRALKAGVSEHGLKDRIRINKAGCMSQCGHGPMLCVYPQDTWYAGVTLEDVEPILDHLRGGPVHQARVYTPEQPGANKTI